MVNRLDGHRKESEVLIHKYNELIAYLKSLKKAAIAFSGGVDSTFLLKAAKTALGENVIALTAVSPVLTKEEEKAAEIFCKEEQIVYKQIPFDVFSIKEFADNPKERCYFCKTELMKQMKKEAALWGTQIVLEGTNLDDEKDYRPGLKAIKEQGIISPLRRCHFTKEEIRLLSSQMKLPTWNKPSMACLASRIPYGERISKELLGKIERAEAFLKQHGFSQIRVRAYPKEMLVRIEVLEEEMPRIMEITLREEITASLRKLGFLYITLDMEGFRSGSMNHK